MGKILDFVKLNFYFLEESIGKMQLLKIKCVVLQYCYCYYYYYYNKTFI